MWLELKAIHKAFDHLVKIVKEHHQPTPSVISQQYKFNSWTQKTVESIAIFVAELQHLDKHCKFGQTLDDMLQDQLVCRISDGCIQCRLLAEPDITVK